MDDTALRIRTARLSDAPALLKIYAPYVEKTAITFEYLVPSKEEFRSRIAHTLERYPYLAAIKGEKPLGYAYVSPFKERAAYSWAVETSIYISEDARGLGLGSQLYKVLEYILKQQNIINLNACITYPNPASIAFHEHFGYKTVAHFTKCGYKLDRWQDMIWMEKMLGAHENPPKEFIPYPEIRKENGNKTEKFSSEGIDL